MSIIAKNEAGEGIKPLEQGVYTATCWALVDLGIQYNEKFDKSMAKVQIMWKIPSEKITINGEEVERTISKEYSLSLNEKSNLTRDLEAWRGRKFTEEELQGFDLINILNKSCQMQIIASEKNGKTYNEISAIMSLAKGMKSEEVEDTFIFDFTDNTTWGNYTKVPKWIQDKIKKATNYEESGVKAYVEDNKLDESIKEADDFITLNAEEEELPF